jgi:pilus assembly protein CpaF
MTTTTGLLQELNTFAQLGDSENWQDLLLHWDEDQQLLALWADLGEGLTPRNPRSDLTPAQLHRWVIRVLESLALSWDSKKPAVDAVLPNGIRLHAIFSPLVRGIAVSLRKSSGALSSTGISLWGHDPGFPFLASQVTLKKNILISGSTGSGKTTLLTELLTKVPAQERLITLEDTPEIQAQHPQKVSLYSRTANADGFGEVSLRDLVKQTLRMRPDRIILGECRGAEILELLQVLNCGHRGTLATIHANSTRDCLRRAELLCMLHGPANLQSPVVRELLASSVDVLVHVERIGNQRKITRIDEVAGMEGQQILLRNQFRIATALAG